MPYPPETHASDATPGSIPPSPAAHVEHLVVVGASAGGTEALQALVGALPADFPAPICVVRHVALGARALLAEILNRAGPLPAAMAEDGQALAPGRVFVAPSGSHLLVEPGRLVLGDGPHENWARPAIDPLFRSAAQIYGPRVIAALLTGNLDDGTAGLWAVKKLGGVTMVQDPDEALYPSMPSHALGHVAIDYRLRLAEMAAVLTGLTAHPVHERQWPAPPQVAMDIAIARGQNARDTGLHAVSSPSPFACPQCHGVLRVWSEAERLRFRCHTGHGYSVGTLMAAVRRGADDAVWNAVRALEESGRLMEYALEHLGPGAATARRLRDGALRAFGSAAQVRAAIEPRRPDDAGIEP